MAQQPDYNETLEILRAAANKSDLITNKYHDVLVYDENSDIDLGDGEFTPSLSKRVKQFVTANGGPVLSVNNESGHVVLGNVVDYNVDTLPAGLKIQKYIDNKIDTVFKGKTVYVDDFILVADNNDHSIAFRRAVAAAGVNGCIAFLGNKTYNMHSPTILLTGQKVTANGGVATLLNMFDRTTYPRGTAVGIIQAGLNLSGVSNNTSGAADVSTVFNKGSATCSLSSVVGINVGDMLNIANYSGVVLAVNEGSVTFDRTATYSIPVGARVYRVSAFTGIDISNLHFDFNGSEASPRYGFGITINGAKNVRVQNITATNVASKVVQYQRTIDSVINNVNCMTGVDNRSDGGHGYVVRLSGGSDGNLLSDIKGVKVRHTVDIAGASRNRVVNCQAFYNDSVSYGTHSLECHYNSFVNCYSYNAVDGAYDFPVGDTYNTIDGGTVVGRFCIGSSNFHPTTVIRNVTFVDTTSNRLLAALVFDSCTFVFGVNGSSAFRYTGSDSTTHIFNNCIFKVTPDALNNCFATVTSTGSVSFDFNSCVFTFNNIVNFGSFGANSNINLDNCVITAPTTTSTLPLFPSSGKINARNTRASFVGGTGLNVFNLVASTSVLHLVNFTAQNCAGIWRRDGTLPLVIIDGITLQNSSVPPAFNNTKIKTNVGYTILSYPPPVGVYTKGDRLYNQNPITGDYIGYVFDGTAWKGFGAIV